MKRKTLVLSGLVAIVGVGGFAVGRADGVNPFIARAEYIGRITDEDRKNPDFFANEALQEAATDNGKLSVVAELSLGDARKGGSGGRGSDLLIVIARQNQLALEQNKTLIQQNKLILEELRKKPKK